MLTVMSFNVLHFKNYVTGEICFEDFAAEIRKFDADVIGLNEVRGALSEGPDPEFLDQARILAEQLGYYYYFAPAILVPGKGPYGNALLSRFSIEDAEVVMVPDPEVRQFEDYYETRCLLKARTGGLNVRVIHFGLNPDEQALAYATVMAHLPAERGVLMGDFNVEPQGLEALAAAAEAAGSDSAAAPATSPSMSPFPGMVDTAAWFTESQLSYPSDTPEIKIDYVFVTEDLTVQQAFIPADVVSDHRPYVVKIQ